MSKDLKVGDYVYTLTTDFRNKYYIKKEVLLEYDIPGNRIVIGSSKQKSSASFYGFSDQEKFLFKTPQEAVNNYIVRKAHCNNTKIQKLNEEIKNIEKETEELLKINYAELKIEYCGDDYVPVDF